MKRRPEPKFPRRAQGQVQRTQPLCSGNTGNRWPAPCRQGERQQAGSEGRHGRCHCTEESLGASSTAFQGGAPGHPAAPPPAVPEATAAQERDASQAGGSSPAGPLAASTSQPHTHMQARGCTPLQQVPLRAGLQPAPPATATLLPHHPRPAGQHQGHPLSPHTTQSSSSTARRRNLQQAVLGQAKVSYWRDAGAMVLQMRKGRRQPKVTSLLQNFPSILILGTVPTLETRQRVSAHEAATRGEPG